MPFDAWTAGLPSGELLNVEVADGDGDGRMDTLAYEYSEASEDSSRAVALSTFVDFGQHEVKGDSQADLQPSGLWGFEQGKYRFDVFVTQRADKVAAVGYTNRSGVVDEIRMGPSVQATTTLIWRRKGENAWQATQPSPPVPLLARDRIGEAHWPRFVAFLNKVGG